MIAALQVLLPHSFYRPVGEELDILTAKVDRYDIAVLPPYQAAANWQDASIESDVPLTDIVKQLGRREPQVSSTGVRIAGMEAIECNALQISFVADSFTRNVPAPGGSIIFDPPLDFAFGILNGSLMALRKVTGAFYVKPLAPEASIWRLGYYNNDGSELAPEKGKLRAHVATSFKMQVCGLDKRIWGNLTKLPTDYSSPAWESLYFEALALLPDIGPSLVLTFSSIEVLLSIVNDSLARISFKPYQIWEWMNSRDVYWKEPSVAERADIIIKSLAGQTLKSQAALWEVFIKLRDFRNSYIHHGILEAKGRTLSAVEGVGLVTASRGILDWLEQLLPVDERQKQFTTELVVEMMKRVT